MAKFPTYPTLYDNVNKISITKLKEWKYLEPQQIFRGVINWSVNGNKTGSISFEINTDTLQPYIILDYKYKDKPINYKIFLKAQKSNLGKGYYYYFVCPVTNKQARKLYLVNGYFLHRTAFKGCMYEKQQQSKHLRFLDKEYSDYFNLDNLYSEVYKKHFKSFYAGKPTKRFIRIMKQINKAEKISKTEMINILIN